MHYNDLTLDQKISLKGLFQTDNNLHIYRAIVLFWGFVKAVEVFLNDDVSILEEDILIKN